MKRFNTLEELFEKAAPYRPIVNAKIEELYDKFESFDWQHGTDLEIGLITLKASINVEGKDVVIFKQKIDSPYIHPIKEFKERYPVETVNVWQTFAYQHVLNFLTNGIY